MALQHAVYVSTPKLNDLGTVASLYKGGKVEFCRGTVSKFDAGIIKAYCMVLTLKSGESATCPLSKKVSTTIKKALDNGVTKRDCLLAILKLNIWETLDGTRNTIGAPVNANNEEEEVVIVSDSSINEPVSYEELAAY